MIISKGHSPSFTEGKLTISLFTQNLDSWLFLSKHKEDNQVENSLSSPNSSPSPQLPSQDGVWMTASTSPFPTHTERHCPASLSCVHRHPGIPASWMRCVCRYSSQGLPSFLCFARNMRVCSSLPNLILLSLELPWLRNSCFPSSFHTQSCWSLPTLALIKCDALGSPDSSYSSHSFQTMSSCGCSRGFSYYPEADEPEGMFLYCTIWGDNQNYVVLGCVIDIANFTNPKMSHETIRRYLRYSQADEPKEQLWNPSAVLDVCHRHGQPTKPKMNHEPVSSPWLSWVPHSFLNFSTKSNHHAPWFCMSPAFWRSN